MFDIATVVDVQACSICGGRDFSKELEKGPWRLLKCQTCDLVFTSPRPRDEVISQRYRDTYYEDGRNSYRELQLAPPSFGDLEIAKQMCRLARTSPSGSLRSVDVGCGGGTLVEAFALAGFESSGVEPSRSLARDGMAAGRPITDMPPEALPPASYEVVTCMHVLEHVADPLMFVGQMARLLVPTGLLVIEVPDYGSRLARRLGREWKALYPGSHLHHFTESTLVELLRRQHLTVVRTTRLGGRVGRRTPEHDGKFENAQHSPLRQTRGFRASLWSLRRLVHASPRLRSSCRSLYWNTLRNGEYLRVIARRETG